MERKQREGNRKGREIGNNLVVCLGGEWKDVNENGKDEIVHTKS